MAFSEAYDAKSFASPGPGSKKPLSWAVGFLLLGALFVISRYNYLLFHALAELFSIAVAWALFMLVWNSRKFVSDKPLVMLGIAYLFIGFIDLFHTLAYKGMNIFNTHQDANLATQLWIGARFMESVNLLLFSMLSGRSIRTGPVLLAYGTATAVFMLTLFVWPVFPACFVDGAGLTLFKKAAEYVICLILAAAVLILWRKREHFDPDVFRLLTAAMLVTMAGELCFTFYVSVYGFSNLVGHYCKILSFYLVYLALIRSGLSRPYAVLFHDLKKSEEGYRFLVENAPISIMKFDASGVVAYVNPYHLKTFGAGRHGADFFVGKKIHELPGIVRAGIGPQIKEILKGKAVTMAGVRFPEFSGGHAGYQNIKAVPFFQDGRVTGGLLLREDVTESRNREQKFEAAFQRTPLMMGISEIADGTYLEVNDTFEQLTGYTRAEAVGKRSVDLGLITEADRSRIKQAIVDHGHIDAADFSIRTRSGSIRDCLIWGQIIELEGRQRLLSMVSDVTEQKRAESERSITIHLLRLINSSKGLQELIRDVVESLADWSGCEAVGIRLQEGDDFPYFETRGFPRTFVKAERFLCAREPSGETLRDAAGNAVLECMCGNVIRGRFDPALPFFTEGGSFWTNSTSELPASTTEADRQARTRNRCNGEGYESVALIPLRYGKESFGLIQLNSRKKGRFSSSLIDLLERLAANLSSAVQERLAAQKLCRERNLLKTVFESTPDFLIFKDATGVYRSVNPAFCRFLGREEADVLGRTDQELFPPEDADLYQQGDREVLETGIPERKDWLVLGREGWRWLQVIKNRVQGGEHGTAGVLCSVRDISQRKRNEELLKARLRLSEFAAGHSMEALLQKTLDEAERLTQSRIGFLHFIHEDQGIIELQMWSSATMRTLCQAQPFQRHYPIEQAGVWADCIRRRRPVIHNDYANLPDRRGLPPGHVPMVREAVVPVLWGDRLVAVLGVGNKDSDYNDEDVSAVSELARMAWEIVVRKRAEEGLSESRQEIQILMNNLPGIAFRCADDPQWTMEFISEGSRTLTGYGPEELIGNRVLSFADIIHPEDRRRVSETIRESLRRQDHYEIEYRILHRTGEVRYVWATGKRVAETGGVNFSLEGFITDRTERKRAEEVARRSDERRKAEMKALARIAVLPSFALGDLAALARELTEQGARALGVERVGVWLFEEAGENLVCLDRFSLSQDRHFSGDVLRRVEYEREFAALEKEKLIAADVASEDERFAGYRETYLKPVGITAMLDAVIRSGGKKLGILCFEHVGNAHHWEPDEISFASQLADHIALAVSNRNRRASEKERIRLATAIDQAVEAVVVADSEGVIQYANPAFQHITEYGDAEAAGRNLQSLAAADNESAFPEILTELRTGNTWRGRMVLRKATGVSFTAEGTFTPITDGAGEFASFVLVMRDITADLAMEKRLFQSQKMEAIGLLAGGIAHDFNNILFPMTGYAEMLQEDLPGDSPLQQNVAGILQAAFRAKDLVNQILSFSRQKEQEKKAIRVQTVLKEALKLARATLPARIKFKEQIDAGCPPILADPVQIHQVIMNLTTNAFHAMEEKGGALGVSLKREELKEGDWDMLPPGSYVNLTITDTGCGIRPECLERIFDPYFTTKEEGKGTGLGMSVVHGIVQDCGGGINVASEPGSGAVFEVLFPALEQERSGKVDDKPQPVFVGGSEQILLADDESVILDMVGSVLERLGYRVRLCASGKDALGAFKLQPDRYDLVITDMNMPGMDGVQLSRELLAIRPGIPIILSSGFSEKIGKKRAKAMGISGLLWKPVRIRVLAEEIRRVLDQGKTIKEEGGRDDR